MKLVESNRKRTGINLTSLVDILFLLIIFFAVSTQFMDQRGFRLELPATKTADRIAASKKLVILMPKADVLVINGKVYSWQNLNQELAKVEYDRKENVLMNVDRSVDHGSVIKLMDILKQNKFEKVAFGTTHAPN